MPQALVQAHSEGDRCVTYNNPTLGLASQGDSKLASPQSRSQSALSWGPRPPAWISSDLGKRPAHPPPVHEANPGTLQPLPLAPSGPWSRSAEPSGSIPNSCGLVAILLHFLSCRSSFRTVRHCACAVSCGVNSRGPRGQLLRMRKHKAFPPLPPNTNPI